MKRKPCRKYSKENKEEAVKLSKRIGKIRAATELAIPTSTLDGWIRYGNFEGNDKRLEGERLLNIENQQLKAANKSLEKANALLKKENEFLEEASFFFAASRQKLAREKE